ncbi:uncharacterized protein [Typha angustifolia]|uniref:uncharacterized protein n=1 Tax=Typha angustifolia TaxID=59011 RepID=UPI003C307FF0
MSTTPVPSAEKRSYQDFIPPHELVKEGGVDSTFLISVAGFKKEEIKVQYDKSGKLIVSGKRRLAGNQWSRFRKELQFPEKCDGKEIRAILENGILYVRLPKTNRQDDQPQTPTPAPSTQTTQTDGTTKDAAIISKTKEAEKEKNGIKESDKRSDLKHKVGGDLDDKRRKVIWSALLVALLGVGLYLYLNYYEQTGERRSRL